MFTKPVSDPADWIAKLLISKMDLQIAALDLSADPDNREKIQKLCDAAEKYVDKKRAVISR